MSENQIIKHKTIEHYQLDNLLWTTPIGNFVLKKPNFGLPPTNCSKRVLCSKK